MTNPTNLCNERTVSAVIKSVGMCVSTAIMGVIMYKVFSRLDPNQESKEAAKKRLAELVNALNLDPALNLNSHEIRIASQIVLPADGVDFEEVGGCKKLLDQLQENVMIPLQLMSSKIQFPSSLYSPPKGILLYGPPGCGKTLIARAIAKRTNAYFINLDISILNDMWFGETAKLTKALFTLTTKIQPCVIFIDEIDSMLRSRTNYDHEATANMKTQFMALWDGFFGSDHSVIIIGATNRPTAVDEAILRRLPLRLHVPKPDLQARVEILQVLLRNENTVDDFDYDKVAQATDSMSGSDMKEVVRLACLSCYRDAVQALINSPEQLQEHINEIKISHDHITKAAKEFKKNATQLASTAFAKDIQLD